MDRRAGSNPVQIYDLLETCRFVPLPRRRSVLLVWRHTSNLLNYPGMHRHFRMLAISGKLQASYVASPHDLHLQPKGIWEKLSKLYNLEALNEIVSYSMGRPVHWLNQIVQEDVTSLALRKDGDYPEEPFCDFDLPDEDYWDMMFAKRIASERPSSPPQLAYQLHKDGPISRARQSTAEYTEGIADLFTIASPLTLAQSLARHQYRIAGVVGRARGPRGHRALQNP